ncbi:MAG: hypothetical protein DYH13_01080 [Alphaproteobacteria bacterium PRO2]|nr:hypothetical protein [Alphaproteobacteria bacterium PRO2]
MVGKIAHICAASRGGARYDNNMTDEQRRNIKNLFLVCGICHDIIDDKDNEDEYPADLLRGYKKTHEERFKKAERQLIEQFVDTTQATQPTYPQNLKGLAKALNVVEMEDCPDDVESIRCFIDKLKELPLTQREFAYRLSERMYRRKVDELPIEDVLNAFQISEKKLKEHMRVIENHNLGCVDEGRKMDGYTVQIYDRSAYTVNPFIEIIEYCESSSYSKDDFLYDLNFVLYDETD